jgi:hypothetical protein
MNSVLKAKLTLHRPKGLEQCDMTDPECITGKWRTRQREERRAVRDKAMAGDLNAAEEYRRSTGGRSVPKSARVLSGMLVTELNLRGRAVGTTRPSQVGMQWQGIS